MIERESESLNFYEPTVEDRKKLKNPRGDLVEGEELIEELEDREYEKIISVGDRVSHDIEESRIKTDLSIIDGKTQREKYSRSEKEITAERKFEAKNPAGSVTKEAWEAVKKASSVSTKSKVLIEGEEDLLGLPAVLFATKDSVIVYGLRNRGAVLMEPDSNKKFVKNLIGLESSHLVVGGSWDLFHSGHRYILSTAYERGSRIDIGVASDSMLRDKLGEEPENSYRKRRNKVERFMRSLGHKNFQTLKLNDIYGNAVNEGEELLVTEDTIANGKKINAKRREKGIEKIDLLKIEKMKSVDGETISSTRMRNKEIDENGLII